MKNNLTRLKNEFTIVEIEDSKKFTINKSSTEKVIIYDEKLLENLVSSKFNQKYRNILYSVVNYEEDDEASEEDARALFLKIDELRSILINKYCKYISKDLLNKYLRMLMILEEKLNMPRHRRGR